MNIRITGQVYGHVMFPERPEHEGAHGLIGGEDVRAERTTFRSPTEAARWCEKILHGTLIPRTVTAAGPLYSPRTEPQWDTACVTVPKALTGEDADTTFRWNGDTWTEGGTDA